MSVIHRPKRKRQIPLPPWWAGLLGFIFIMALTTAGPAAPPPPDVLPADELARTQAGNQDPVVTPNAYFPFGQCTWLAAKLRPDIGVLVSGDAWNWANVLGVDSGPTPRVDAVAVYQPFVQAGVFGHVAVVVRVMADGSYLEEGMNAPIFGQIAYRVGRPGPGVRFLYAPKGQSIPPALVQPPGVTTIGPAPAPQVVVPTSFNDRMVTVLSVIGDDTYRDPPDLEGIRVLIQQTKVQGADGFDVPLSQIGVWTYPDTLDLNAIRVEVQRQKAKLGA